MLIVSRYFWFIAPFFIAITALSWRRRAAPLVRTGAVSAHDVHVLLGGLVLVSFIAGFALGTISLVAGYSSPMCAGVLNFSDGPKALSAVITLAINASLLYWLWFRDGAAMLGRVAPVLMAPSPTKRSWSPRPIRVVLTVLFVVSTVASAALSRMMPALPECATPTQPV